MSGGIRLIDFTAGSISPGREFVRAGQSLESGGPAFVKYFIFMNEI